MPRFLKETNKQGFTLVETLVSIMIMAISLAIILQLFSGGLNAGRVSEGYTRGIFYAQEKMEEILLEKKLSNVTLSGEFQDGYSWTAIIEYQGVGEEFEPSEDVLQKPALDLFKVSVDVKWQDGNKEKHFDISTLTIAEWIENTEPT